MSVPCFVAGTLIATPAGEVQVELLRLGDLVNTKDHGPQPIRWVEFRHSTFGELTKTGQYPVEFKPGSLGLGRPRRRLRASPQHRILVEGDSFAPARGLVGMSKVRSMTRCRWVRYHHILFSKHEVIYAEGVLTKSLLPGPTFLSGCRITDRLAIMRIADKSSESARALLSVSEDKRFVQQRTSATFA